MFSTGQIQRFRFRLSDAVCPDMHQILRQVTPEVELCGEVLFLSDSGEQKDRFAIMEVKGIALPLVVPLERLVRESPSMSGVLPKAG